MKCRKNYADKEKYRKYRNGCNARYYGRTTNAPKSRMRWTDEEIELLMKRGVTDTVLSDMIGRSVRAIQLKRHKIVAGE